MSTNKPRTTKNTSAFYAQAAISFGVALLGLAFAALYMPGDPWMRAFIAMTTLFLVSSSFTLAKVIRDNQEDAGDLQPARPGPRRADPRRARPLPRGGLTERPDTAAHGAPDRAPRLRRTTTLADHEASRVRRDDLHLPRHPLGGALAQRDRVALDLPGAGGLLGDVGGAEARSRRSCRRGAARTPSGRGPAAGRCPPGRNTICSSVSSSWTCTQRPLTSSGFTRSRRSCRGERLARTGQAGAHPRHLAGGEHEHRRVVDVVHVVHEHVAVGRVAARRPSGRSARRCWGPRSSACPARGRRRCSRGCRPRCGAG